MNKILWLDVETSGINPKYNGIVQVAGIIVIDGEEVERFNFKMCPPEGTEINAKALEVSNFTEEQIKEFPASEVQYNQFKAILDKHVNKYDRRDKFVLAGYNVTFDSNFLLHWFQKHGDKYLYSYLHGAKLDVNSLVAHYCIKKQVQPENFKLATIANLLGLDGKFHDAMEDIIITKQIYKMIT